MRFLLVEPRKKHKRAFLAAAFLLVLLSEWGSHSMICSGQTFVGEDERSISAAGHGHEDPCRSLVLCSDNKQRDRQAPKLGHDATQHNGLIDVLASLRPNVAVAGDVPIPLGSGDALFRPPKPPFHPPKQS